MIELRKTQRLKMKCPECNHYIYGILRKKGDAAYKCPLCKTAVYCKEHNQGKEKYIKIVKI